jgi:hypothetical protein
MAKQPIATFKNDTRPSGLAGVGFRKGANIKTNKRVVGRIDAPHWATRETAYKVRLAILTPENDCGWGWITLQYQGESLESTKEWVKANWPKIAEKYSFHFLYE